MLCKVTSGLTQVSVCQRACLSSILDVNVIQRSLTCGRSDAVAAFGRVIGPVGTDQREAA